MKTLFAAILPFLCALTALAGDIKPADPGVFLFQIFASLPDKADPSSVTFDEKKPLLTVHSVRDLILASDNKGVMLGLTEKDTQALATLTRKYKDQILILRAGGTVIEPMRITAPIEDGYLGFKHPQSAAVAEYLRKRFRIAEFE